MALAQNYLEPEIICQILIEQGPVVLKHFEYQKNFGNLFQLISPFYLISDVDPDRIFDTDFFDTYLSQLQENYKRPFLFLQVDAPKVLDALQNFPRLPFLAIQKDPESPYDYSNFPNVMIYDNKSQAAAYTGGGPLQDELEWTTSYLLPKVQNSLVEAQNYLSSLFNTIHNLIGAAADPKPGIFVPLFAPYTPLERKIIVTMAEQYFNIGLRGEIPLEELQNPSLETGKQQKRENSVLKPHSSERLKNIETKTKAFSLNQRGLAPEIGGLLEAIDEEIAKMNGSAPMQNNKHRQEMVIARKTEKFQSDIVTPSTQDTSSLPDSPVSTRNLEMDLQNSGKLSEFNKIFLARYQTLEKNIRCTPTNLVLLRQKTEELLNRVKESINSNL